MARFFIERPIFAWVVALFIILAGIISIALLPVAQYPNVAPPAINITVVYPGASAKTLDETVISIIEGEINGAEGMIYMSSVSQVNGTAEIMVTFESGTDPDMAQVDIQNRLAKAAPRLPQAVTQQGIQVAKANSNILMVITLSSKDGKYDRFALGDYASRNLLPEIQRAPGVGQTRVFGAERAIRVWLDMPKMAGFNLTVDDVNNAIKAQNAQVSSGIMGDLPSIDHQAISATLVVSGQLVNVEQFENIIIKANANGSSLRLKDIARVEIGGQSYSISARKNGAPIIGLAIQPSPSSNAVNTVKEVNARLKKLEQYFPEGMEYDSPIDASKFIRISIIKVVETLLEAMLLVFVVMFVFLQNIRYTLIPAIVVPIALLGTFSILLVTGFSINVLTMFAMVLAIGILVDDAIVVVENVERIMAEEGLPPREATIKAMRQITGAIIGITVVLVSVFIPMAFFGGSVGNIYRQFSITMAVSILFSAMLALSLTPALCATLLKPISDKDKKNKRGFFAWFNRNFSSASNRYQKIVTGVVGKTGRYLVVYVCIVVLGIFLMLRLPTSFLPDEDQGRIFTITQLPPGATIERSTEVAKKIEDFYRAQPEVDTVISILGTNFFGAGQNMVNMFVSLKDWSERKGEEHSADALAKRAFMALMPMQEAFSVAINLPPIPELGNGSGFSVRLQDRSGLGYEALQDARNQFLAMANESKVLANVRVEGVEDAPQLQLDIDREKAYALGVSFADINRLLSVAVGSSYVNDFPNQGRMQRVIVQADASFRMQEEGLLKMQVRNDQGKMLPISAFATTRWITGPMQLIRYNSYPAFRISGSAAEGYSTGDAMKAIDEMMLKLPKGIGHEWTGISREERISGAQTPLLLGLSLLAVFLCLAALYESWSIPFSVMLVVPLGVIGSLLAVTLLSMPNDVYFKVGLIAIIGLSAKNAILIIEFAKDLQAQGYELIDATLLACKQRFRPILMTSMAFILGVFPLAFASGAGSAAQRAIGMGVMGGMISATILAIFFVPVFFVVVRSFFKGSPRQEILFHKEAEEKMFNENKGE
jgi:multidrug efflux pump